MKVNPQNIAKSAANAAKKSGSSQSGAAGSSKLLFGKPVQSQSEASALKQEEKIDSKTLFGKPKSEPKAPSSVQPAESKLLFGKPVPASSQPTSGSGFISATSTSTLFGQPTKNLFGSSSSGADSSKLLFGKPAADKTSDAIKEKADSDNGGLMRPSLFGKQQVSEVHLIMIFCLPVTYFFHSAQMIVIILLRHFQW